MYVDPERYDLVLGRLKLQAREAVWWKDACILFYQSVNNLPLPKGITPPIYDLNKLKRIQFPSNVHFCPSPADVNKALDGALKTR
jgi:alpha-glucuronidase